MGPLEEILQSFVRVWQTLWSMPMGLVNWMVDGQPYSLTWGQALLGIAGLHVVLWALLSLGGGRQHGE